MSANGMEISYARYLNVKRLLATDHNEAGAGSRSMPGSWLKAVRRAPAVVKRWLSSNAPKVPAASRYSLNMLVRTLRRKRLSIFEVRSDTLESLQSAPDAI